MQRVHEGRMGKVLSQKHYTFSMPRCPDVALFFCVLAICSRQQHTAGPGLVLRCGSGARCITLIRAGTINGYGGGSFYLILNLLDFLEDTHVACDTSTPARRQSVQSSAS